MKKEQDSDIKFLEEQLQWCKEQDRILEQIETTLHEMKGIAIYVAENKLSTLETEKLETEMD